MQRGVGVKTRSFLLSYPLKERRGEWAPKVDGHTSAPDERRTAVQELMNRWSYTFVIYRADKSNASVHAEYKNLPRCEEL
jgi:hypothetical protein